MNLTKPTTTAFLLTTAIVFLVSFNSLSQEQFRLSEYKNPDYRWQKLDLGFSLGGGNSLKTVGIENGTNEKRINSQFNNRLSAHYYGTKNSATYQGFQEIGFNSSLSTGSIDYENLDSAGQGELSKIKNGSIGLSVATTNRFYNRKKMFFEANLDLYTHYSRQVMDNSADQETLPFYYKSGFYQFDLDAGVPLLVGIGRIEEVQDARLAIYILDDLVSSGDIKRNPTNEEILAFSEFITQTKNKRYFDARLRKIAEITAIDSFLTVKGLKAESDASYYTLINDNWDFASGPVRSTGGRFSIGISPSMSHTYSENENLVRDTLGYPSVIESYSSVSKSQTNAWSMDFLSGYTWEKPSSLYWQHSFNANLVYSLYTKNFNLKLYTHDTLSIETERRIDSPNLGLNIGYKIGYYPNSRTQITLGVNSGYQQFWGNQVEDEEDEIDIGNILVENSIQLLCYYYISPQLRLTVSIGSHYIFTMKNQERPGDETGDELRHSFQNNIGAGLVYSIF